MNAIYSYVFPQMGSGNYARYKKHEDFYKDEYEKCVCVCVHARAHLVAHSYPTLCNPMDCSPPDSSVHGDSPGKNTGVGCPPPGNLPNLGIEPRSPSLQVDSLLSEPPGKPYEKFTLSNGGADL